MENLSYIPVKERGKEEKQEVKEKEMSEEELIEFLKSREPGDPEAVELLRKWIDREQKKVGPNSKDQLSSNIRWAQMYEQAGWIEGEGRMKM